MDTLRTRKPLYVRVASSNITFDGKAEVTIVDSIPIVIINYGDRIWFTCDFKKLEDTKASIEDIIDLKIEESRGRLSFTLSTFDGYQSIITYLLSNAEPAIRTASYNPT